MESAKIKLEKFPLEKAFMLAESGNVLLLTTSLDGRDNVMTLSWHMVLDFSPAFAFVVGDWDFSCAALALTRECVLAVPPAALMKTAVGIGSVSGADCDKFKKFKLGKAPASAVVAPLLPQCIANIECRVVERFRSRDIFVVEAVAAWFNASLKNAEGFHAVGDGTFIKGGERVANFRRAMLKKPSVGTLWGR